MLKLSNSPSGASVQDFPTASAPNNLPARQEVCSTLITADFHKAVKSYQSDETTNPLFFNGDALVVLRDMPDACIDVVMTSPPYWGKREYDSGGIGRETDYKEFVRDLPRDKTYSKVTRLFLAEHR